MSRWEERKNKLKTALGFFNGMNWEGINTNFIVSTGRTGTEFLARFFNSLSSDIDARHEPDPDFLKLGVEYAKGKVFFEKACRIIKKGRLWICDEVKKRDKNIYIEANNRFFSLIPVLRKVFPKAKIIHIVRDGRDYVRSVMNRNYYTPQDKIYYKKDLRLQAIDFPEDLYNNKWKNMSRFEKCCWEWVKKDSFIHETIKDDPLAETFKFEDIFYKKDGIEKVWQMGDFMNLDVDRDYLEYQWKELIDKKINLSKTYKFPGWDKWDEKMRKQFMDIAGGHVKKYGYHRKSFSQL